LKAKRIIRNGLKWGGYAVLFAAVLELCARVDDWLTWGAPLIGHYSPELLTVGDEYGRHGRPNAQFEKWELDSHGFRGPEIARVKPSGVTRVAFLGASETFGLYESKGHEFPAQVRSLLETARPGEYEIINAGCAGMTFPRIKKFYAGYVSEFDPDIVIIYPSPPQYLAGSPPSRDPKPVKQRALGDNLRLTRRAKVRLQGFVPAGVQFRVRKEKVQRMVAQHKPGWQWEEPPADRLKRFIEDLSELVDVIEASGAKVVLATHANRFAAGRPRWEHLAGMPMLSPEARERWATVDRMQMLAWRETFPRPTDAALLATDRAANEMVREMGRERRLPVVDVANEVPPYGLIERKVKTGNERKDRPRRVEHFADFAHFSDRGARFAADAFVRQILAMRSE
jgi:hypothetical protein